MKVKEIRELGADEIQSRIEDTRKQIVEMRFQHAARKLENPAKIKASRKTLSRLLTIKTEKLHELKRIERGTE